MTDVSATAIEVRFGGREADGTYRDGLRVLRPGGELFGLSFEELARRGVGAVEVGDGDYGGARALGGQPPPEVTAFRT